MLYLANNSLNHTFKMPSQTCHAHDAPHTFVDFTIGIWMVLLLFCREKYIFAASKGSYMPHPNTFTNCWNYMHYCMFHWEKSLWTHFVRKEKVSCWIVLCKDISLLHICYSTNCMHNDTPFDVAPGTQFYCMTIYRPSVQSWTNIIYYNCFIIPIKQRTIIQCHI